MNSLTINHQGQAFNVHLWRFSAAFQPPKYLEVLWLNHHLHHYKHPDKAFGLSSMLWDTLFGTLPDLPEKRIAQSGS